MKNVFGTLLLLAFCVVSCDNGTSGEPLISVDSIYVDNVRVIDMSQPISKNSTVDVYATLLASEGATLKTFNVKVDCDKGEECLETKIIDHVKDDVSNIGGDLNTSLRFKDGVIKSSAVVQAKLLVEMDKYLIFKLNLNTDDSGVIEQLVFNIAESKEGK